MLNHPCEALKPLINRHYLEPLRKCLQLLHRKPRMLVARRALARTSFKLGITDSFHLEPVIAEVAHQQIHLNRFFQSLFSDEVNVKPD